jgi:hypothetical protein
MTFPSSIMLVAAVTDVALCSWIRSRFIGGRSDRRGLERLGLTQLRVCARLAS